MKRWNIIGTSEVQYALDTPSPEKLHCVSLVAEAAVHVWLEKLDRLTEVVRASTSFWGLLLFSLLSEIM
jgi:hypothetical protein